MRIYGKNVALRSYTAINWIKQWFSNTSSRHSVHLSCFIFVMQIKTNDFGTLDKSMSAFRKTHLHLQSNDGSSSQILYIFLNVLRITVTNCVMRTGVKISFQILWLPQLDVGLVRPTWFGSVWKNVLWNKNTKTLINNLCCFYLRFDLGHRTKLFFYDFKALKFELHSKALYFFMLLSDLLYPS